MSLLSRNFHKTWHTVFKRVVVRSFSVVPPNIQGNLDYRLKHADKLISQDRLKDARSVLSSALSSTEPSSSEAALLLRKLLVLNFIDPALVADSDRIRTIHEQFERYSSKADLHDERVIQFYCELARRYYICDDAASASRIIDYLKSSAPNVNGLVWQLWMQFEIEHCEWVGLIHLQSFEKAKSKLYSLIFSANEILSMCSKDCPDYALVLNSYSELIKKAALLNLANGEYAAACEVITPVLDLAQAKDDSNDTVMALKSYLAIAFANQSKIEKAIGICESLASSQLPTTFETARIFSGLAELMLTCSPSTLMLSQKLSTIAVTILSTLAIESCSGASIYGTHGVILNALGKFDDAKTSLQKAITLLPKNDQRLRLIYHNLGCAYLGSKEFDKAASSLEHAIEKYKEGDASQSMATCYGHLGEAYEKLFRHDEAEAAISDAVAMKRELMPRSTQLVVDLQNLAAFKQRSGFKQEAVDLYYEAVEIISEHLGESHLQTACARRLLANALIGVRKIHEAVLECEKAYPVLERDGSNPQYEHLVRQYCQLLILVGRHAEARTLSEKLKSKKLQSSLDK